MPFAPHEIENKRFVVGLRGYHTEEVDAFLRAVAADYRAALEAASGDTAKADHLVVEVERVMARALEQAKSDDGHRESIAELQRVMQATTAELRASAQADAAEIRAAAQADATEIRAAARSSVAELQHILDSTRERAERDAAELRAAAQAEAAELRAAAQASIGELQKLLPTGETNAGELRGVLEAVTGEFRAAAQAEAAQIRAAAMTDAAEIRAAAQSDANQLRAAAHVEANVPELRLTAQKHAREVRVAAEAEASEIRAAAEAEAEELRAQAEREAAEIRDAAIRESEAAYAQISQQAQELRRLEASLWSRMHALEHTVMECRQALSHVSDLHPIEPGAVNSNPLATTTLPTVDELLYRVESASVGTETNVEVATADL